MEQLVQVPFGEQVPQLPGQLMQALVVLPSGLTSFPGQGEQVPM
jgi:hypothetical protein